MNQPIAPHVGFDLSEIEIEIPPLALDVSDVELPDLEPFDFDLSEIPPLALELPDVELEKMAVEIDLWLWHVFGEMNRKMMTCGQVGRYFSVPKIALARYGEPMSMGGFEPFRRPSPTHARTCAHAYACARTMPAFDGGWNLSNGVKSSLYVIQIVPKIHFTVDFDCQIIAGRLYYRTVADDGTPSLRPLDRPKDLDKGLLRDIRNRMTPEERRTLTVPDILRILRDGARTADPLPEPWAVRPEVECEGTLARPFGIKHVSKSHEKAVTLPFALASGVLTRHRDPSARIAPLFVLARPSEAPRVLAMLSALTLGCVHEHGPGHGEAPPGTLAEVWRLPPLSDPSGFWLDVRGDSRTVRPVPVVICNPCDWCFWHDFFMEASRYGRLPVFRLYEATDPEPMSSYVAEAVWSGLLSSDDVPTKPRRLTVEDVEKAGRDLESYLDGFDGSVGVTGPEPIPSASSDLGSVPPPVE